MSGIGETEAKQVTGDPGRAQLAQDRSRRTRAKILASSRALFVSKGFEETTVAEICRAAGVSKASFFYHFAHKERVLMELTELGAERIRQATAHVVDKSPPAQAIYEVVGRWLTAVSLVPRRLAIKSIAVLVSEFGEWREVNGGSMALERTVREIYEAAQRRGELATSVDVNDLTTSTIAIAYWSVARWLAEGKPIATQKATLQRRLEPLLGSALTETS